MRPRRWTVADRISVAVLLGAAAAVAFAWHSGTIEGIRGETLRQVTEALAAEGGGCGDACRPLTPAAPEGPATSMAFAR